MLLNINGEPKKVACGPCIRGHRSSKCTHSDRVLLEVRKPGRPLSSCPHPSGSCGCERAVIHYTVPKTSACACPAPAVGNNSTRVQKHRKKKSMSNANAAVLEKALKVSPKVEIGDSVPSPPASSKPSIPSSATVAWDSGASTAPSPLSSASSTPRIDPAPSVKGSCCSDLKLQDAQPFYSLQPTQSSSGGPLAQASCCGGPTSTSRVLEPSPPKKLGGCCSNKTEAPTQPAMNKSCCSGSAQIPTEDQIQQPLNQLQRHANTGRLIHQMYALPQQTRTSNGSHINPPFFANGSTSSRQSDLSSFGFNEPIYNHLSGSYQQPGWMDSSTIPPTTPVQNHAMDAGCNCGPGCMCFACSEHPNNPTTMSYVREIVQSQVNDGYGNMPSQFSGLGAHLGPQPFQNFNVGNVMTAFDFTKPVGQPQLDSSILPNGQLNLQMSWQQDHTQPLGQVGHGQHYSDFSFSQNHHQLALKTETPPTPMPEAGTPATMDSPSGDKDSDEGAALTPTRYTPWLTVEIEQGGACSLAPDLCKCGEDCQCDGCLTHSGHIEPSSLDQAVIKDESAQFTTPYGFENPLFQDIGSTSAAQQWQYNPAPY